MNERVDGGGWHISYSSVHCIAAHVCHNITSGQFAMERAWHHEPSAASQESLGRSTAAGVDRPLISTPRRQLRSL